MTTSNSYAITNPVTPSAMDVEHLRLLRENVNRFLAQCADEFGAGAQRLLDIAPQVHAGAKSFFPKHVAIETFDIDPQSGCTYIGDITKPNDAIASDRFDIVVCTEVLEHTLQPFHAVAEMRRILRPGGLLLLTVPFNFRIHGPLPDCWRFTEHGLRALLADFTLVRLEGLETPERPLMPIHYTVVARK